jgi:hypothetical protein
VVLDHIARVELWPGATRHYLAQWRAITRQPRSIFPSWSDHSDCCEPLGYPPFCRAALQKVIDDLPPFASRRLGHLVQALDEVYLARALPNPCTPPDAPWWHRRIRWIDPQLLAGISSRHDIGVPTIGTHMTNEPRRSHAT